MKNPTRFNTKQVAVFATLALSHVATGQITKTYIWNLEEGPGNWGVAANWALDGNATTVAPKLLTDRGRIDNAGTANIITNQVVEVGEIFVAGAGGSFLVAANNSATSARQIRIGNDQVGTFTNNGGLVQLVGQDTAAVLEPMFIIGIEGGGNGTYTQTAGDLDASATRLDGSRPDFWIGAFGATGVFNLQGGTADLYNLRIGFANPNGGGTLNHSGGLLTHTGDFALGWAHINGVYNLSGTGELSIPLNNDRVRIGATGEAIGHFNQTGGTANIAARFEIGTEGAAIGYYDVSGGIMNVTNDVCVGTFGAGTTGHYTQTGGTVTVNRIRVGIESGTSGILALNGGTLTTGVVYVENAGATGTLSFDGGTIKATGGGNYIYGFPQVTVNAGGAIIDSNNQGIDIAPPLKGVGGLTKKGAGYVSLTAKSDYSGNTIVEEGVLRLNVVGGLKATSNVVIPSTGAGLELNFTGTETVSHLIVDGVSLAPGTYGSNLVAGSHIPVSYISGNGLLKVEPAAGYDTWASNPANGLAVGERAPGFDADYDGISNLVEYTLGGNPKVASTSILPTIAVTGGNIQFNFNRSVDSASDTTAVIQWSTDLGQWLPANQIVVTGSGAISQTIPVANAANGKLFTRLKVTKP